MQLRINERKQWFVSAKIAGARMEEIELLVDTGAKFIHINDKKCRELRLTPNDVIGFPCIHGDIKSRPKYIGRIQIDEIHYSKNDIDIVGLISEGDAKLPIGIIGTDVLVNLRLSLDGKDQGIIESRNQT